MSAVDAERLIAAPRVDRRIAAGNTGLDLESITAVNPQHRPPLVELCRTGHHGKLCARHLTDRRRWPPGASGVHVLRRPPAVVDCHHGHSERAAQG
mgnify:CR=1 FL=1